LAEDLTLNDLVSAFRLELLENGFTPEDLDTFASSVRVGVTLQATAIEVVQAAHAAMPPRALEALMGSLAGRLRGWAKQDVTSPFALRFFCEGVHTALSTAKPSALPALCRRLMSVPAAAASGEK